MVDRKHRVALILPRGHEYAARLVEGVVEVARERPEFDVVEVPYNESGAISAVDVLGASGALVWTHRGDRWVLDLRDRGVKVVSFNAEWVAERIPCVSFDLDAMLDTVVDHLAELQRKHAAYVGHLISQNPAKQAVRDAFLERARRRGWTVRAFEVPGIPSEEHYRLDNPAEETELAEFLRGLGRPACIHCDDDYVGVLVCRVAEHLGLSVPDDLAVLGLMDLLVARLVRPTLSSIPVPGQAVGPPPSWQ